MLTNQQLINVVQYLWWNLVDVDIVSWQHNSMTGHVYIIDDGNKITTQRNREIEKRKRWRKVYLKKPKWAYVHWMTGSWSSNLISYVYTWHCCNMLPHDQLKGTEDCVFYMNAAFVCHCCLKQRKVQACMDCHDHLTGCQRLCLLTWWLHV